MRAHLIVKAEDHSSAWCAAEDHLGGAELQMVSGPIAIDPNEWSILVEGDTVTIHHLNVWFCQHHDEGAPYPFGTLLLWTEVHDE